MRPCSRSYGSNITQTSAKTNITHENISTVVQTRERKLLNIDQAWTSWTMSFTTDKFFFQVTHAASRSLSASLFAIRCLSADATLLCNRKVSVIYRQRVFAVDLHFQYSFTAGDVYIARHCCSPAELTSNTPKKSHFSPLSTSLTSKFVYLLLTSNNHSVALCICVLNADYFL